MNRLFAALAAYCVCCVSGNVAAQTTNPTPTPLPQDQPGATTTYAGGVITTLVPGQFIFVSTEDGRFSISIPLTSKLFRFLDKRGVAIDPAAITSSARVQAILDGDAPKPLIKQIMVDQE